MKKSKSNEGLRLRKMGFKLLCILKSHTKGNVNSNFSSCLTFSKEIFGGNSSSRGFGKSGNNVPVLELREYFRAENDPCTQRKRRLFVNYIERDYKWRRKGRQHPKKVTSRKTNILSSGLVLSFCIRRTCNETVQIFFTHFWLLIKSFQVFWVIELRRGKVARPTEGNYRIFSSRGGFIARKSKGTNRHRESLFFFSA